MKHLLILIIFPFTYLSQTLNWLDSLHESYRTYCTGVSSDIKGDVYTLGAIRSHARAGWPPDSINGFYLIKYSSSGNKVWASKSYSKGWLYTTSIAINSSGEVHTAINLPGDSMVIDGTVYYGIHRSGHSLYLLNFDTSGNVGWVKGLGNLTSPARVIIYGAEILVSGGLYGDGYVVKTDEGGNLLLTIPLMEGRDLATDAQGNIYCVEGDGSGWNWKHTVKKFSPSGTLIWSYPSAAAIRMTCDAAGNVFILEHGINGYAPLTKLNTHGLLLWQKTTPLWGGNDFRITLDEFGNLYATGLQLENGSILACFDATGATSWTLAVPYRYEPSQIEVKDNRLVVAATKWGVQKNKGYVFHFAPPGSLTTVPEINNATFTIFPNPSSQVFTLSYCGSTSVPANLFLYDLTGKCVLRKTSQAGEFKETLDLSGFAKGIYFLELVHGQEKQTRKLVLE